MSRQLATIRTPAREMNWKLLLVRWYLMFDFNFTAWPHLTDKHQLKLSPLVNHSDIITILHSHRYASCFHQLRVSSPNTPCPSSTLVQCGVNIVFWNICTDNWDQIQLSFKLLPNCANIARSGYYYYCILYRYLQLLVLPRSIVLLIVINKYGVHCNTKQCQKVFRVHRQNKNNHTALLISRLIGTTYNTQHSIPPKQ